MESDVEYSARKQRELSWLNAWLEHPLSLDPAPDCDAVVAQKLQLRTALFAELASRRPDLTETWSRRGKPDAIGPWQLAYQYQRFDLAVAGPFPYADWSFPSIQRVRYASSGMGALSALLLALNQVRPGATVVTHCDAYFETLELLRHLARSVVVSVERTREDVLRSLAQSPEPRVLLLDTLGSEDPARTLADLPLSEVDLVVLDTTLYDAHDGRIEELVRACFAREAPVVLVRSHLKLDFLGVEWGRLGSIVGAMSPFGITEARQRLFREVLAQVDYCIRWLGVGPLPIFLPPFAGDPEFAAMNSVRLARMEENHRFLAERLNADLPAARCTAFHHGRFLTLDPYPVEDNFGPIQDAIDRLVAGGTGLAIRPGNSFGFDFTALAATVDGHRGNRRVLRVATGDQPLPVIDRTVGLLVDVLAT